MRLENTAISIGVARSAIELEKRCNKKLRVLDYGSGKLRNSTYLNNKGFCISVIDTAYQMSRLKEDDLICFEKVYTLDSFPDEELYDVILCSFVINVIPDEFERLNILNRIYNHLKPNGQLFLEVRKQGSIEKNKFKIVYKDGYLIGKNSVKTFQKGFSADELNYLFKYTDFYVNEVRSFTDSYMVLAIKPIIH